MPISGIYSLCCHAITNLLHAPDWMSLHDVLLSDDVTAVPYARYWHTWSFELVGYHAINSLNARVLNSSMPRKPVCSDQMSPPPPPPPNVNTTEDVWTESPDGNTVESHTCPSHTPHASTFTALLIKIHSHDYVFSLGKCIHEAANPKHCKRIYTDIRTRLHSSFPPHREVDKQSGKWQMDQCSPTYVV